MKSLRSSLRLFTAAACGFVILTSHAGRAGDHLRGFGPPQTTLTESLAAATRTLAGDVNGDGLDDLILFNDIANTVRICINTTLPGAADVSFGPSQQWAADFCTGAETPLAGDWNGDGLCDIGCVSVPLFSPDPDFNNWRELRVAYSNGFNFVNSGIYTTRLARPGDLVRTGDVNGDGAADFIVFDRTPAARVSVLPSALGSHTLLTCRATDFCRAGEIPHVGDVDGDGYADLVTFNNSTGSVRVARNAWPRDQFISLANEADFLVPLNNGDLWMQLFAVSSLPAVADVTGDGRADIVEFVQAARMVNVAHSTGSNFQGAGFGGLTYQSAFAGENDQPLLGKFDADRNADAAALVRPGPAVPFTGVQAVVAGGHARPVPAPFNLGIGTLANDAQGLPRAALGARRLLVMRTLYESLAPNSGLPSKADLARRLFGTGTNPPADTVAAYFSHISYGHFTFTPATGVGLENGVVEVTVPLSAPAASWPMRLKQVEDIPGFSFTEFDDDGDGIIETHECTVMEVNGVASGGVVTRDFVVSPQGYPGIVFTQNIIQLAGGELNTDGKLYTTCHELTHTIGAPDMYDPNGGAMLAQTLLGGNPGGMFINHVDAYHRMRLGWFTPRSFDLAAPFCAAKQINPTTLGTPDVTLPVHLFDSRRPYAKPEHYLVEYRDSQTRFESSVATGATGRVNGGVFWALHTNGTTGGTQYEQVLAPGPDGVLNAAPNRAGDDWLMPALNPGPTRFIRGGDNFVLDTPFIPFPGANSDVVFPIPCVFPTNNPWEWPDRGGYTPNGAQWKFWRQVDDLINLSWRNGAGIDRQFRVATDAAGAALSLQWGENFTPWLQSLSEPQFAGTQHLAGDVVTVSGAFGAEAWSARVWNYAAGELTAATATAGPFAVTVEIPQRCRSGEYALYFRRADLTGRVSNALTLHVTNPFLDWLLTHVPNATSQIAAWAPGLDYDGDGLSNLAEYILNTDPDNSASGPGRVLLDFNTPGSVRVLWSQYTTHTSPWTLIAETSTDLQSWTARPSTSGSSILLPYRTWSATLTPVPARLFTRLTAIRVP